MISITNVHTIHNITCDCPKEQQFIAPAVRRAAEPTPSQRKMSAHSLPILALSHIHAHTVSLCVTDASACYRPWEDGMQLTDLPPGAARGSLCGGREGLAFGRHRGALAPLQRAHKCDHTTMYTHAFDKLEARTYEHTKTMFTVCRLEDNP